MGGAKDRLQAAKVLMRDEYEAGRELSLAITKLDECVMWLERAQEKPKARGL